MHILVPSLTYQSLWPYTFEHLDQTFQINFSSSQKWILSQCCKKWKLKLNCIIINSNGYKWHLSSFFSQLIHLSIFEEPDRGAMESLQRICLREKGTLSVLFHESEIGFSWFGGLVLPVCSCLKLPEAKQTTATL